MASTSRLSSPEIHRRDVIEEVEWLTDCQESPELIARRLGYASAKNLARMLERWERPGLARRINRVETAA